MSAAKGRNLALTWGGSAIGGVREKSFTLNGEPINVTSDEDSGWQTLLADLSQEDSVEVSVSGITKSEALKTDWFAGNRTKTIVLTSPDGGVLSGTFFMSNYKDTGPYNDAMTFEATFMSSGTVVWTPGA